MTGRHIAFPEQILLKLSEGTKARIDKIATNRNGFIRMAIENEIERRNTWRRASAVPEKNPEPTVDTPSASEVGLSSRATILLTHLRKHGTATPAGACRDLGWAQIGYDRAERELLDAGMIEIIGGCVMLSDTVHPD